MNQQKVAIVTGASQGIGAGLVEAFLKCGYNVVANSRNITKTNHVLGVCEPCAGRWRHRRAENGRNDRGYRCIPIWLGRCIDQQRWYFHPEALHRIYDRRFQRFGFHDACGLSLHFAVSGEADAATEKRQHRQRINDTCRPRGRRPRSCSSDHG